MAALQAKMGFDAQFFARIDYQDRLTRLESKEMELIWMPETSQGNENLIFTHIMPYMYHAPLNYSFDVRYKQAAPVKDDPRLEGYDVD